MKKHLWAAVLTASLLAVSVTGCGNSNDPMISETLASSGADGETEVSGEGEGQAAYAGAAAEDVIVVSEMFTDRDLSGGYDASEAEEIILSEGDVTITKEGVYLISGSLKDGMIIIDADDSAKVQLVLDGVDINNSTNAAIYVKQADKVFITLAEGSRNSLTSSGYTVLDNNIDGVIFAKSDLTINGTGSLTVNAAQGHGIVTKDDLKITGGEVTVTSEDHGLSGKDSVRVTNCTLQITSGKDGIHSENDAKEEKGFIYIAGGTVNVVSEGDGISAGNVIQIDGGTIDILAGGGSTNRSTATDENGDAVSTKGIKASGELLINQGTIDIDSQDDAVHSNSEVVINGGELSLATGDDGIHGDEAAKVRGGNINISTSYEGIEGTQVEISGGTISLYATDDGLNAGGGRDQSGFGGMFGGMFGGESFGGGRRGGDRSGDTNENPSADVSADTTGESYILISGGTIYVRADGDGLDSNGTLTVTGGEVYVSGPENGANGAIDYESSGQITGGTVVAVGNSAMAMNFGDSSTQGSIMINTNNHASGTEITLKDASGKELVQYTSECSFNSVVISCPELVLGGTYTITAGEESTEVTLSDSLIYGSGFGGGGFGGGGMMPGGNRGGGRMTEDGQMPEGMEIPEGGQMPEGMEIPDGGKQNGGRMPEGMEIPDGGQMPEGMEIPDGGKQNGGRMPEGMGMPGGGMSGGMGPGRR